LHNHHHYCALSSPSYSLEMALSISEYLSSKPIMFFVAFFWRLTVLEILYLLKNSPLDNSVFILGGISSDLDMLSPSDLDMLWFLLRSDLLWWVSDAKSRCHDFLNHFQLWLYFSIFKSKEIYKMILIQNYLTFYLLQIHNQYFFLTIILFYFQPRLILSFQPHLQTNSSLS
jgi:hypothetical protein